MSKYFGTDGFRGEANKALNVEHAYKIGRFLGAYYGREHKCSVVIGKDTRRSGYMFECALTAGLTASGADAYLMHVTTTPSVSYITRTDDFDCGIMISASHNPYFDNGIKLLNGDGEKMEQYVIDEIERYLDGKGAEIPFATGSDIGKAVDYAAGRNRYIGYLISLATHSYKGMRIGLDCANGSTWMMAKSIFETLGAETVVIGNQPNGLNINNDCGSTHIEGLRRLVTENKLDVGFAFDGDADRCLAVDEKGNIIDGDKLIAILSRYMKEMGTLKNNTAVVTVMSNLGFHRFMNENKIETVCTKVGDRYVLEEMLNNGYNIGGEQSGHIIFLDHATTGDGQLTAAQTLELLSKCKRPLSQLVKDIPDFPQLLVNVKITEDKKGLWDKTEKITDIIAQAEQAMGENGRILVRESGTEPLVRVMIEGKDEKEVHHWTHLIADTIKECLCR